MDFFHFFSHIRRSSGMIDIIVKFQHNPFPKIIGPTPFNITNYLYCLYVCLSTLFFSSSMCPFINLLPRALQQLYVVSHHFEKHPFFFIQKGTIGLLWTKCMNTFDFSISDSTDSKIINLLNATISFDSCTKSKLNGNL